MPRPGPRLIHSRYIKCLENRQLYTEETIILNAKKIGIFAPNDDDRKARQRLRNFMKNQFFPPEGDGKIEDAFGALRRAYFGARLKIKLPEGYISEAERQAAQDALDELLLRGTPPVQPYVQSLTKAHDEDWRALSRQIGEINDMVGVRLSSLAGMIERQEQRQRQMEDRIGEWLPPKEEKRSWASRAGALLQRAWNGLRRRPIGRKLKVAAWLTAALTGGVFILNALRGPTALQLPLSGQTRIAVLYCADDPVGPTFASSLATALDASEYIRAVPNARVEKGGERFLPCQTPTMKKLDEAKSQFRVNAVLWGKVESHDNEFVYKGALYHESGYKQPIQVRSPSSLYLPDQVAQRCLAALGLSGETIATEYFYSENEKANLLYGEARLLYDRREFSSALELFRRATVFDPRFTKAKVDYARCLFLTGEYRSAIEALETLLAEADRDDDGLHPNLRAEVYRDLAKFYYKIGHYEKLRPLLAAAQTFGRSSEPVDQLYFTLMEARLALAEGQHEESAIHLQKMMRLAKRVEDPEAAIDALRTEGYAFFDQKRYDEAIASWREALRLAEENRLISERIEIIAKIGKLLFFQGDPAAIGEHYPRLKAAYQIALDRGNLVDEALVHYWLGRFAFYYDDEEEGRAHLEKAIASADRAGDLETHISAISVLADHFIANGSIAHAAILVEPFHNQLSTLPPRFSILLCDRAYRIHYLRKETEKALEMLNLLIEKAELANNPLSLSHGFYAKGFINLELGHFTEAVILFKQSLDVNPDAHSLTRKLALQKIIEALEKLGEFERARMYRNQLSRLSQ